MTTKNMTDEEFVRVWQSALSRQEVAEKCGASGATVSTRAGKLRELGVNLKHFTRGRKRKSINVKGLNQIILNVGS